MKSTHTILIILVLLIIPTCWVINGQSIELDWLINGGGSNSDCANAVVVDKSENSYITGYFNNISNFGSFSLKSLGGSDIFLAKLGKNGECLWAKQAGSSFYQKNTVTDVGTDLVLVNDSYLYITGSFTGEAFFDNTKLVSSGLNDVFLAKYDTDGNLIWVKQAGGINQDLSYSIVADDKGNIYITGSFQNQAKFDNRYVNTPNGVDAFIAKYDSDGNLFWIKQFQCKSRCIGKSLSFCNGYLYIAGIFDNTIKFQDHELISNGLDDIFICCLNSEGELKWLEVIGSNQNDNISSIKACEANVYFTGSFMNEISFNNSKISSNGSKDILLGSMTNTGKIRWLKDLGGPYFDEGRSITFDQNENILLLGSFQGLVQVDKNSSIKSSGFSDIFLANIASNGTVNAIKGFGSDGQENATKIFFNSNNIYVSGSFMNQLVFNDKTILSNGRSDYALFKLSTLKNDLLKSESFNPFTFDSEQITLFPNPTFGEIKVKCSYEINSIEIETIDGKKQHVFNNINSNNCVIKCDDLVAGGYIMVINCNNKAIRKIFIKQ